MDNNTKGFWHKAGITLGLIEEAASEKRGDTVVYGPASAPSGRSIGAAMTTGDALSLVGVYRAVSILATAVKQLPMDVFRAGSQIETPLLVKSPSMTFNRTTVMEQTVLSLALSGNAYWRLIRSGAGDAVQAIEVLNPHEVFIEANDKGYTTGYRYMGKQYKKEDVKHLALLRVPGSNYGLGPIQAAQRTLIGAADVRDYASNWFSEGNIPSGVLTTDKQVDSDMAAAYRDAFEASITGGGTAVLGQGVTYSPIYLSPRDAQFLETQQFTKTEIATLFGIPSLYMLADGGNSTSYSNQQQVDVAFLKFTLSQYLVEIEQAMSDLLPRGQEARFNTEGLLRTDTKSRYEAFQIGINSRWLTPNEVRAVEGLDPIEGGDELVQPQAAPNSSNNEGGQE